jgi:hypothetical protein
VAEPVAPKPVPSVIATPPKSDELVGNSAAARQKAVLYGAVLSGNASMGQMLQLKAACVQLQDMPCAGMAVRMIRRKKAAQSAK